MKKILIIFLFFSIAATGQDAMVDFILSEGTEETTLDISTAVYNQSFTISESSNTTGLYFKPDGTKMYVIDAQSIETVDEYSLSTAWDISSLSYIQSTPTSLLSQDDLFEDIYFKPDGTKMYLVGQTNDNIYEYSLSTAWDVTSASYSQNYDVSTQSSSPHAVYFKPDGTKMYICDRSNRDIYEYSLSTAWDVTSASYSQTLDISLNADRPHGLSFKSDGLSLFIVSALSDYIYQYSLSTAWDISSASYYSSLNISGYESVVEGIFLNSDLNKVWIIGSGGEINEFDL